MTLTVYSMGDLPIFTSVLNGVAIIFNSSLFDPAQGAGVVLMGMLIGLLFMIFPAVTQGKLDTKPFIFVIMLLYAGIIPKERLQVIDAFSGNVTAVDNIPLIVALPASIAASLANGLTQQIETAFQTSSGTYLSLGAEGFVNPLKLLLSLRDPQTTFKAFPYLSSSITEFEIYCAPTDPTYSLNTLAAAPDILGYLEGLNVTGFMTYYSAANPQGTMGSCKDGQTWLASDTTSTALTPSYNNAARTTTAGNYAQALSGLGATTAGYQSAYNSFTAGLVANTQTAQQFMVNMIALTPIAQGVDCANQPAGPNMSTCLSQVIEQQALEQSNIDNAGQAGVFVQTIVPASNILLALFYALSPLVLAVAFISGAAHGMKVLMGFLMFSFGTQAWMPVAAVINYMIQMQTQYALSSFPPEGVTLQNYMQFYNIISVKVGLASNLMASAQMLSFALISGSMYSLSSLAGSVTAKDKVDEKMAAPDLAKVDPLVHVGGALEQGYRSTLHSVGGGIMNSPGQTFMERGGLNTFETLSSGSDTGQSTQTLQALTTQSTKKQNETFQHGLEHAYTKANGQTDYDKLSKTLEGSHSKQMDASRDYVNSMAASQGWSDSTKEAVAAQMTARLAMNSGSNPITNAAIGTIAGEAVDAAYVAAGPDGFQEKDALKNAGGVMAAGAAGGVSTAVGLTDAQLKVEATKKTERDKQSMEDFKTAAQSSSSERASATNKLATNFSHGVGQDLQTTLASTFGKTDKQAYTVAHEKAETAQEATQAAINRQSVAGTKRSMTSNEMAAYVKDKGLASAQIDHFAKGLDENETAIYYERLKEGKDLLNSQGYTVQDRPEAYLAKQMEALNATGKKGSDEVWAIAAGAGASATGNVPGELFGNTKYDNLILDGAKTADDTKDVEKQAAIADGAKDLTGPAQEVNQRTVGRDMQMARLKTDPAQTAEKVDVNTLHSMGEVKDPHKA